MKILQFIKSHKLVTSAIVLSLVAGTGSVMALNNADDSEQVAQTFTSSDVVKTLDPTSPSPAPQTPEPTSSPEPVETSPPPSVEPSPQPVIKTTQEYGSMYLDLTSNVLYQPCFDKIQQMFPDRFTPEVREKNVKALRSFANVCSTAVLEAGTNRWIVSLGRNGEFFDSEQAKQFN